MKVSHEGGDLILDFCLKSGRPDFRERTVVEETISKLMAQYKQQLLDEEEKEKQRVQAEADAAAAAAEEAERKAKSPPETRPVGLKRSLSYDSKVFVLHFVSLLTRNNRRTKRWAIEVSVLLLIPLISLFFFPHWKVSLPPEEIKRRGDLLKNNATVAELHRRLVAGGLVSDADFWKYNAMRMARNQNLAVNTAGEVKKGIPSVWDPELPPEDSSGVLTVRLTPAMKNRIFVQHPEVELAYRANVPKKMKDKSFWEQFAKSRYFHKGRSGTATEADKLFAKYEDKASEALEQEMKQRSNGLNIALDLNRVDDHRVVHVRDVHEEGGSMLKHDMYLPKLKHFNRHGKLVLDSNASTDAAQVNWKVDADEAAHPIPDLEEDVLPKLVPLTLSNKSAFFEGIGSTGNAIKAEPTIGVQPKDLERLVREFESWEPDLTKYQRVIPAAIQIQTELFQQRD